MADGRASVAAGFAVAAAYLAARAASVEALDRRVSRLLARPLGPAADVALGAVTDLGSIYAVAGMATGLAARGQRAAARDVVGAGVTAWVAAQALKPAVGRRRPYESDVVTRLVAEPAGSSWPSGHPAVAAAVVTALLPRLRGRAAPAAAGAAAVVAASRVYVGVHYLADVVAGLGLGVLCGRAWRRVLRTR